METIELTIEFKGNEFGSIHPNVIPHLLRRAEVKATVKDGVYSVAGKGNVSAFLDTLQWFFDQWGRQFPIAELEELVADRAKLAALIISGSTI